MYRFPIIHYIDNMTIELFTLCDGAYNYNGKLTIVGTLTSLGVPRVPVNIQLGLAMKIKVASEESGTKQMTIRFVNPDGTNIPADLTVRLDLVPKKETSFISLAANVQNLPITQLGELTIKVLIDNSWLSEYHINVAIKDN